MSNIDKINSVDLELILQSLWISYKKNWDNIVLSNSDWWRWNISKWIIHDFNPWKTRASWDRINFVQSYLWITFKETLNWFASNFNIKLEKMESIERENLIKEKYNNLEQINSEQIEYLKSRWIIWVEEFTRDYNWNICIPIKSWAGNIISLQSRSINPNSPSRYYVEWWTNSDWVFMTEFNSSIPFLLVVEWFTDWLSLRQYTTNVVGLVNAKNDWWLKTIREFSNKYEIYFIPDNDEAGTTCLNKMKELNFPFSTFNLVEYWVKDVNELLTSFPIWENIIPSILEESIKPPKPKSNLELAIERAFKIKERWVILTWDSTIDEMTAWLMRGSTFLINGASWQWKTTFSLHLLRCLMKKNRWIKINYYSLETDVGRQIMQIIGFATWHSEKQIFDNLDFYKSEILKLEWLELFDNIRNLEEIKNHITKTNPDVAFIDFCQKVQIDWIYDETAKWIKYAQNMQDFAIDNGNVAIVSLSQINMWWYDIPILNRMPKSSWALKESSDNMVNIWRDENYNWVIWWIKAKNIWAKWRYKTSSTHYDYKTWEYIIFPPDENITTIKSTSNYKKL